ncbi:MAG: patatin-like phospholipase family protein [Pseudomonadales bacterium]
MLLRTPKIVALVVLLIVSANAARATDSIGGVEPAGPKIVLVLSGGGARGAAHIGVLRALEELQVPVHGIVGTSMGAVVGALYAAGYSPEALERLAITLDWGDLFRDDPSRDSFRFRRKQGDSKLLVRAASGIDAQGLRFPQGYLYGHKLKALFARHTLQVADVEQFAALPIPFAAVATDISSGEPVLLDHGDLAEAMFASMAIPALIAPIEIDGRLLVDGGVANNLPVDVALAMGADIIIAVDVSSPLRRQDELPSLLAVTDQLTNILTRNNTEVQIARLRPEDLLLVPVLEHFSAVDFNRLEAAIPAGHEAVHQRAAALAGFRQAAAPFAAHLARQRREPLTHIAVREVVISSDSLVEQQRLAARIDLQPGLIRVEDIEAAANELYGLELFAEVPYQYRDGQLTLKPARKPWGPNYLQFGLGLEDDFAGRNHYRLGLALTATEFNRAGSELRLEAFIGDRPTLAAEFYQPLGADWFVRPSVGWRGFRRSEFVADERVADFQIQQRGIGVGVGRNFGTTSELRFDALRAWGSSGRLVGDPALRTRDADSGLLALRLQHDTLDNLYFPRHGRAAELELTWSDERLGAAADYRAWELSYTQALSRQRHSLVLSTEFASVFDGTAPFHEAFTLGGFFNLSGLPVDRKLGQQRALQRAAYRYRWLENFVMPVYLGASVEAGQVWQRRDAVSFRELDVAGSLFVGLDSPLGPLYLGAGIAEGGNRSLYVVLGQPF